MDLSRILMDRHEICTKVWCEIKPENLRAKNFYPTPKKFGGEPSNFAELSPTRRQLEARNFETAQHIDKQKASCIIYDNCTKTVPNFGHHPHGVLMQPREKVGRL